MEKSVIERLSEVKAVVISYDLWMICNTEEIFSLTAHYFTVWERKSTHIEMPSTTGTGGVSLSFSVMEVVENFGLESKIVVINSDGGGNHWVCREALESKYTNDSVFFFTQAPIHYGVPCTYISRGFQGGSTINQAG